MVIADIRWRQQFENFRRAFDLLGEPIGRGVELLSALEQPAAISKLAVSGL